MSKSIKLKPLNTKLINFSVIGTTPLIQHGWSSKGRIQMRMTAQERRKQPKLARDPEKEAEGATYYLNGGYGFPLLALKASLINAAHKDIGIEKTMFRKSFFIVSDDPDKLIEMQCSEPKIREDIVRIGNNQTDLRYRPEFKTWGFNVTAEFDADNLTEEDIINLVNRAGFGVGVLEWRPEKGGEFGRFQVDTTHPISVSEV